MAKLGFVETARVEPDNIGLAALVIATAIVGAFQRYILAAVGEGAVFNARRSLANRLLRLSMSEFDLRRRGDLIARVSSDATLLRSVLTQGVVELAGGIVTLIGAFIAMLLLDYVLLLTAIAIVGAAVLIASIISRRLSPLTRLAQQEVGELAANLDRSLSAIRTVRASNATRRETSKIIENADLVRKLGISAGRIQAIVSSISGLTTQVAFIAILGVGGLRVAGGQLEVSTLVSFILFLFMFVMPLGRAFGIMSVVNQTLGAVSRINEVLALPAEADNDAADMAEPRAISAVAIEFVGVSFSYPRSAENADAERARSAPVVLRDVSFEVPTGKRTAIVGPSGAGKSTILALIERFYDDCDGSILMNGVDIQTVGRDKLRAQLGYVEQDAPVLAGTFRDNLLLAAPGATEADCREVMKQVNLLSIVDRAPDGLDSQVGESGVTLSGGERQRLAIARTLLSAPPILLLDESTSHLDSLNEQLMRDAIDSVAYGRTLVVIAHRLATVIDADQIIVMEEGEVAAAGTHDELIATSGLYRDLARRQLLV